MFFFVSDRKQRTVLRCVLYGFTRVSVATAFLFKQLYEGFGELLRSQYLAGYERHNTITHVTHL